MTFVLVRKLLRDIRWPLLTVMLLLCVFTMLWVKIAQRVTAEIAPFFNGVAALSQLNPKVFEEVLFKGPGRISQAVMGGGEVRFENPTDFLAVELLHPVVITLVCLWSIGRASGAVAGELDRGTLELLLSQPVPRRRLIVAHLIVDAIVIPAIVLSIAAGTHLGLAVVGPFKVDYSVLDALKTKAPIPIPTGPDVLPVHTAGQWGSLLNLAALMFAVSGLTIAISSLNRSRWKATGLATGLILGMFIVNVIGQLWDTLAVARPISLFFYYQPQKIWLKNQWFADWSSLGGSKTPLFETPVLMILAAVGLSGYLIASKTLERRDLPAPL
jgi:ABC-2 type transport system permease protein